MKKKIIASILLSCITISCLFGCGKQNTQTNNTTGKEKSKDKYHFEIIVQSYQSSYWQAAALGIQEAAADLDVDVNCTGPNTESDIADQVNMINSAINSSPDGIGIAACDQNSVLDSLQKAYDKKIPVVCFDSGVPDAPKESVYSTIASDNYKAGELAAENLYDTLKDTIDAASSPVRIGEINQEATSESIISRGMGFIDKFSELAKNDGKTVAVTGHEYYSNHCKEPGTLSDADIIIDVAVPAQTTVELCATEASKILNKEDTIAIYGSNQVAAEGILTANVNLNCLGSDPSQNILSVGFDAGATIKAAVRDGVMLGAVTQAPIEMGRVTVETLTKIANNETVSDIATPCYWYNAQNMDDDEIAPNLYD